MESKRLRRCTQCGELRGRGRFASGAGDDLEWVELLCLCQGIVCRHCRRNAIHRPASRYFDDRTLSVWYVPTFGYRMKCGECSGRRG
ncbi:MAG: hypothetical protein ACRDNE_14200 [Gaiellaceae bacterium]